MVRALVTCLEDGLNTLEAKDTLISSDLRTVERLFKKIEALNAEFKELHYAVIDLVGNYEQILDEEQAVMDDHKDKVSEIVLCLQQLWPDSKAASLAAHSTDQGMHLGKRFCYMEISLRTVNEALEPLAPDLASTTAYYSNSRSASPV